MTSNGKTLVLKSFDYVFIGYAQKNLLELTSLRAITSIEIRVVHIWISLYPIKVGPTLRVVVIVTQNSVAYRLMPFTDFSICESRDV